MDLFLIYQLNLIFSSVIFKASPQARRLKMELAGYCLKVGRSSSNSSSSSSFSAAPSAQQSSTWKLEACKAAALITVTPLLQAFLHGSNSTKMRAEEYSTLRIRFNSHISTSLNFVNMYM